MSHFDRNAPPPSASARGASLRAGSSPNAAPRDSQKDEGTQRRSSGNFVSAAAIPSGIGSRGGAGEGGALDGRSLLRVRCSAGSGALEYTHAFVTAYAADHFRGAVAQRLSVGAYELLSNALNFGSVSGDIVLELVESESLVGVRVANEAIQARISMLAEHLTKLRTNAEQTFLEELRRSVTGGIPRPMLGLARVTHEAGLTLDFQVQDRRVTVTAHCRR